MDLVKGDLLRADMKSRGNEGTYIFDGCKIINLDYSLNYHGDLPQQFNVITNNVPIKYWFNTIFCYCFIKNNNSLIFYYGKGDINYERNYYNNIIKINITQIKDQCLNNIKPDGVTKFSQYKSYDLYNEILYTDFEYNNKTYTIFIPGGYTTICKQDYTDFNNYMNGNNILEFDLYGGIFIDNIPNSMYVNY